MALWLRQLRLQHLLPFAAQNSRLTHILRGRFHGAKVLLLSSDAGARGGARVPAVPRGALHAGFAFGWGWLEEPWELPLDAAGRLCPTNLGLW